MNVKVKEFIRSLVKYTSTYKEARASMECQFAVERLREAVDTAIKHVPYYRDNGYAEFFDEENFDITRFPILHKGNVIGREAEFVSDKYCRFFLRQEKTGGSTGHSMRLFYSPTLSISRMAQPTIIYDRYVGKPFLVGMLRGNKPAVGGLRQRIGGQRIVYSSYQMSEDALDDYLDTMRRDGITCLLAYPSSISVFARLIRDRYGTADLPALKAIIASSEIFSRDDKEVVMQVFPNAAVIDYYSMSEFAAAAYSVGLGNYEFNNNYGYVEFIDTGDRTPAGNRICEIVATSIMNDTMPLIRYATADYAEIDADGNVLNIIGRSSDYAVNRNGELTPCIVVFSKKPMLKVLQFQYYQDTPGKLEFHIIPRGADFTEEDRQILIHDMETSFNGTVDCDVVIVDHMEKTRIGKLRRMVQRLNLSEYK